MAFDLVQVKKLADQKEDENWKFRQFVKHECDLEETAVDQRVFETTPTFSEDDVKRLAKRLAACHCLWNKPLRSANRAHLIATSAVPGAVASLKIPTVSGQDSGVGRRGVPIFRPGVLPPFSSV
jgi:hypothetical protein